MLDEYRKAVAELIANSHQPMLELPPLRDRFALVWNDDGGPGYSAAFEFKVPEDGDYYLIAGSSLSAAFVCEGEGMPTRGTLTLYIDETAVGSAQIKTQPGNFSLVGEACASDTMAAPSNRSLWM